MMHRTDIIARYSQRTVDDETLYRRATQSDNEPAPAPKPETAYRQVKPAPDDLGFEVQDVGRDTSKPPPRPWLLGNTICGTYVSALIAAGSGGKTALALVQALSLSSGRTLTGDHVFRPCRVLYALFEDDDNELKRRCDAALMHHRVKPAEVAGRFFTAALGRTGWKITDLEGLAGQADLSRHLKHMITRLQIDVLFLDPLVRIHAAQENDNPAMDRVMSSLNDIAYETGCAIVFVHHTPKGPPDPGNPDKSRGASAVIDAVRLAFTLTRMSKEDAAKLGVSEKERLWLIRVDSAKTNLTPPASEAKWFKLVSVAIGNGDGGLYSKGDNIQSVELWRPPDLFAAVDEGAVEGILAEIDQGLPGGQRYTNEAAAKTRAVWKVVQRYLPDTSEEQARAMVKQWIDSGILRYETFTDKDRHQRKGLRWVHDLHEQI
jgi:hypothetical protein